MRATDEELARWERGEPLHPAQATRPLPKPAPPKDALVYTPAEVAQLTRVHVHTIYRAINAGHLRAIRLHRAYRIPATAVRDWVGPAIFGESQ